MPEAFINGISLYYEIDGSGKDSLVLIHGLGSDGTAWALQRPAFAQSFRLIIPDLRGHGRSSGYDKPYTIQEIATDIVHLLDHNQVEKAHILGSSMGGMVAQCLGIFYPQRVSRLVIANSESYISPRLRMILENWIDLAEHLGYRAYIQNTIPWVYTESFFNDHVDLIKARIDELSIRPVAALVQAAKAVLSYDVSGLLDRISVPSLIISSELDTLVASENAQVFMENIPNAHLEIINGSGHMVAIERPKTFNEIVLRFLSEVTSGSTG